MSTNPLGPNVPIPAIVTVTPVPELSITDHDKRTVWVPPIVTLPGLAEKELIVGGGHGLAVTVVCDVACAPQPTVAVNV